MTDIVTAAKPFVRSGSVLNRAIEAFARKHGGYVRHAEGLAWEVLSHAALHGDPSLLNKFFNVLDGTWGTAFGTWIGKVLATYGNKNADTDKPVRWLSFKDNLFTVKAGLEPDRHDWLRRVMTDGKRIGFLSVPKDTNKIASAFDDAKVVENLKALAKKAGKDGSEVSSDLARVLSETVAKAERIAARRLLATAE